MLTGNGYMKTTIVTGASSGIGAAIARAFAKAGYNVMAAGRDNGRLESVASEHPNIRPWIGDISKAATCDDLVAATLACFGQIDTLVNNAGIIIRATTAETSDDDWRSTMAVNLDAAFYLSRSAMPHLLKQRGAIINIASDWGLQGGERAVAYCASKGALVQMTRAMALDHAQQGLRVNAICPGDVNTPMLLKEALDLSKDPAQALDDCDRESPTGRVTTSNEVAALALFLASDVARQITGAAIPIDGGNTA
jgi:NAD(P)-dependent dehydrogenase (short-subunit alcohol dehydrogenase family)